MGHLAWISSRGPHPQTMYTPSQAYSAAVGNSALRSLWEEPNMQVGSHIYDRYMSGIVTCQPSMQVTLRVDSSVRNALIKG